jgi:subtilisin family serine protease
MVSSTSGVVDATATTAEIPGSRPTQVQRWIVRFKPVVVTEIASVAATQSLMDTSKVDENKPHVGDLNGNGYIDADDLLHDPRWTDGIDTDHNGFVDDFFGWNFSASEDDWFAQNNPSDHLGHGTHVAGTIAAIGNNGSGVTGISWQSSIVALKFLDQNNQGSVSDTILAMNYATMMRTRTTNPVNVPILNASWGQPGEFNPNLRSAIEASGNADILFVAARRCLAPRT